MHYHPCKPIFLSNTSNAKPIFPGQLPTPGIHLVVSLTRLLRREGRSISCAFDKVFTDHCHKGCRISRFQDIKGKSFASFHVQSVRPLRYSILGLLLVNSTTAFTRFHPFELLHPSCTIRLNRLDQILPLISSIII